MSPDGSAYDSIIVVRNDEALDEFRALGFTLAKPMRAVLDSIDNQRSVKQVLGHPRLRLVPEASAAVRSLIKLGFIFALPKPSGERGTADTAETATLNSPQRLREAPESLQSSLMPSHDRAREPLPERSQLEALELERLKADLLAELSNVLGNDVQLIGPRIIAVRNSTELMEVATLCASKLRYGVSVAAADQFTKTFREMFNSPV